MAAVEVPLVSPRPQPNNLQWKKVGLCVGLGAAADKIFFPERGESARQAKKICARCPVTEACLEYALTSGEHIGVWGGTTERERKRIRRNGHL